MMRATVRLAIVCLGVGCLQAGSAHADGDLGNVNHVIIVMQENHSFDNYFGVLPNAPPLTMQVPGSYHNNQGNGPCPTSDHTCVDSLNCTRATTKNTAPRKTTFRKNQNRIFAYNGNLTFTSRNPFPDQSACSPPNEAFG